MTDLSKTPELWRLLRPDEIAQSGDQWWDCEAEIWDSVESCKNLISKPDFSLTPIRRRMEDPTAPLRAELREAYAQIESLYELADEHGYAGPAAKEWLIRNAGFGPGKGEP